MRHIFSGEDPLYEKKREMLEVEGRYQRDVFRALESLNEFRRGLLEGIAN